MGISTVRDLIVAHEESRQFAYDDATGQTIAPESLVKGNVTVGIGRNLHGKGLSQDEIGYLFNNDMNEAVAFLQQYSWYTSLNSPRQAALIDMVFNMGGFRFSGFHQMIACLASGDYAGAAAQMLDSDAAKELPERYGQLSQMIESGSWPA